MTAQPNAKISLEQQVLNAFATGQSVGEVLGLNQQCANTIAYLAHYEYSSGNFQSAAKLFGILTINFMNRADCWLGLAKCHLSLKNYVEAFDSYGMAEILNPQPQIALLKIKSVYFLKNYAKCAEFTRESLQKYPNMPEDYAVKFHNFLELCTKELAKNND